MKLLAKNRYTDFRVKSSKKKEFIEEINKNKITESFLEECKKASSLFTKK